jgi:hypothetical protein
MRCNWKRDFVRARAAGLALLLLLAPGCGFVGNLLGARSVTVELANEGEYPIEVEVYYHDDQDVLSDLIDDVGTLRTFTVPPGQTTTFSLSCDDLQAIQVRRAKLLVIGTIGPEASTSVQRDGTNFNCGDRLTFTFDHSAVLIDFAVTFTRARAPSGLDALVAIPPAPSAEPSAG